jgi:hydroxyacylglutathione hydrolase
MPIVVERIVLSRDYASNCYLIRADAGSAQAAVVDPGGDPAPLLAELDRLGASTGGILVTHTDVDHVAGVAQLAEAAGAEVWVPAGEADALRRGETRGGFAVEPHEPEHTVVDGDLIMVAGIEFEVVGIPGHSVDHVAFCAEGSLFAGDLLFAGSVGRTDFPGGDWSSLVASIQRLLDRFGPDATLYPGHGEPISLGPELETNPFLGDLRAAR